MSETLFDTIPDTIEGLPNICGASLQDVMHFDCPTCAA